VGGDPVDVRLLSVAEVADIMRVSRMTVYRLVHSGDLPARRSGRSLRILEQAVHDHLRQSVEDTA
jgi:excisionase family DNA binding protein